MRKWIDEETGAKMCEPDCVDEWLFKILSLGFDYDGCHTVKEFKELVDELVDMSKKARECLWDIKLFGVHGSPYKKSYWLIEKFVEEMPKESILDRYYTVKLPDNISIKELEEELKDINVFDDTIKMMKGETN